MLKVASCFSQGLGQRPEHPGWAVFGGAMGAMTAARMHVMRTDKYRSCCIGGLADRGLLI